MHTQIFFKAIERKPYLDILIASCAVYFLLKTLFIFCYLGTYLTTMAFEVNESIYNAEKYTFQSTKNSKTYHFDNETFAKEIDNVGILFGCLLIGKFQRCK